MQRQLQGAQDREDEQEETLHAGRKEQERERRYPALDRTNRWGEPLGCQDDFAANVDGRGGYKYVGRGTHTQEASSLNYSGGGQSSSEKLVGDMRSQELAELFSKAFV